jgi:hypothetical protein
MYRGLRSLQIKSLAVISACVVVAGCLSSSGSLYSKSAPFYQDLVWVSHRFNVRVDGQNLVLSSDVGSYTHALEGSVVGADVGDLNQDGYPEVLMYLSSPDDGRYGSVIGYSSNRGRSLSQIYAPLATNDAKYKRGYYGHDEFAIVEGTLVQRFPIHPADRITSELAPTTRQVQYKLVDGEAGRRLVVSKVIEY